MLKKILVFSFVAVLLVSGSVFARKSNKIKIAGSTTVFPIAQKCAEVYMDKHPKIRITVRGGGSGVGIASIVAGKVDIGDASRPIKNKELKKARAAGINPVGNVVAKDAIAIVVNNANPISKITVDQIKKIYTGEIVNWKELGGPNKKIVIASRDSSSGTYETFETKVLKGAKVLAGALKLPSNKAVATTVAQTPEAIGYVGLGYVTDALKAVPVNGVEASVATVNDATYPISRSLFMYTQGKPKGKVKNFIDFILSSEGQSIVSEVGFVPLTK